MFGDALEGKKDLIVYFKRQKLPVLSRRVIQRYNDRVREG
jgi:hypothetical protein